MANPSLIAGNNARTIDAAITTTAKTLTLTLVPLSIAFYTDAWFSAPATNTDTIYFRINGPVADSTTGESLAPGESRHLEGYIRSVSAISASGTQSIEVEGRG